VPDDASGRALIFEDGHYRARSAIARPSGARSPKYVVLSNKFDSIYHIVCHVDA